MTTRTSRAKTDQPSAAEMLQLLRGALDALTAHVAILDEETIILHVNDAWRAFGKANGLADPASGVGANYLQITNAAVARDDAWAVVARNAILDLVGGRAAAANFEYPCHSPDAPRWFVFRGAAFDVDGRRHVVVSHDNVTQRHLAEEELRASHEALGSFNSAVSHDLRAPLRRIEALCHLAREDAALPESADAVIGRIEGEAVRARSLVMDLLDLAAVSTFQLETAPLDVSRLAHEALDPLITSEPARRVEIHIEPGMRDHADPRIVRLILLNLLSNAWKFTSRRSDARIEVGTTIDEQGRHAYFVRDNGIGFGDADPLLLFRPFARLDNARGFEGTGIGLASVRRAAERHGGRVWATATPNGGATFWFTLGGK